MAGFNVYEVFQNQETIAVEARVIVRSGCHREERLPRTCTHVDVEVGMGWDRLGAYRLTAGNISTAEMRRAAVENGCEFLGHFQIQLGENLVLLFRSFAITIGKVRNR